MSIFKSTSRFKDSEVITTNGKTFPALMKRFEFLDVDNIGEQNVIRVQVLGNRAGRPDLISEDLYGTAIFKWVLILFNNVTNPFDGWPKANTVIQAPKNDMVWREL
jgi:hypothetical protein